MIDFNGLAQAASYVSLSAGQPLISECCQEFIKFLQNLSRLYGDANKDAVVGSDAEDFGGRFLSEAASLQVGYFKDMEILCAMYELVFQILSCLRSNDLNFRFKKKNIVSAFSVLQDGEGGAQTLTDRDKGFEDEMKNEWRKQVMQDGEHILMRLTSAILDMKNRMREAAKALQAVFLREEPRICTLERLTKIVQSFLSLEDLEDSPGRVGPSDLHKCLQVNDLSELGSVGGISFQETIVSELLGSDGPFVVGIAGPRGIGKTFLATSVASDYRIKRRFVGGIYWVSESPTTKLLRLHHISLRTGSKFSEISSVTAGLEELKADFSECSPSIIIVDDAWNATQLERLVLLFDNKDQGRFLVTACSPQIFSSMEASVHEISRLKAEDALNMFRTSMGNNHHLSLENEDIITELVNMCDGLPLLIQTLVNMLRPSFPHSRSVMDMLLNVENKQTREQKQMVEESTGKQESEEVCNDFVYAAEGRDKTLENYKFRLLVACFWSLGFIHPILQECFLDMVAFAEGEWVTFSSLEKLWLSIGNGLSRDEIMVILSIMVCRSVADWHICTSFNGSSETYNCIEIKLHEPFYHLASSINFEEVQIHKNEKAGSSDDGVLYEFPNSKNCSRIIKTLYRRMRGTSKGFSSPYVLMNGNQENKIQSLELVPVESREATNTSVYGLNASTEDRKSTIQLKNTSVFNCCSKFSRFRKECRLFELYNVKYISEEAPKEVLKRATKISDHCNSIEKFSVIAECPLSRVCLLSGNEKITCIPSSFITQLRKLLVLDLSGCTLLKYLPKEISALKCLKLLDLSFCTSLKCLSSSLGCLENLKCLRVSGCTLLTSLPRAIGLLTNLEVLQVSGCEKLKHLPSSIGQLSLLKVLDMKGCLSLRSLPSTLGSLRRLCFLDLSNCCNVSYSFPYHVLLLFLLLGNYKTVSMAVPPALWNLDQIEVLQLVSLKNLTFLPSSVLNLQQVRRLSISRCRRMDSLPEELGKMSSLQELDLSYTAIRKLPNSVGQLCNLRHLSLKGCSRLLSIPTSVSNLQKLKCLDLSECCGLVLLPSSIVDDSSSLSELLELNISYGCFKTLPAFSPNALPRLQCLKLVRCSVLDSIPPTFQHLTSLQNIDLEGCQSLRSLDGICLSKFRRLQLLSLRNCTSLAYLPLEELAELNSLEYLDISGCNLLCQVPQQLQSRVHKGDLTLIRWGAVWH